MSRIPFLTSLLFAIFLISCGTKEDGVLLESPDGTIQFRCTVDESTNVRYDVLYRDSLIIEDGLLGLALKKGGSTGKRVMLGNVEKGSVETHWKPVYGEKSEYSDHYNHVAIELADIETGSVKMTLKVRAYNEGIAFCYQLPSGHNVVVREDTEFSFNRPVDAWVAYQAQGPIQKIPLKDVSEECERPLLVEWDPHTYVALGEASLTDFARMKFALDNQRPNTLHSALTGEAEAEGELLTPWRYVMIGESPSEILENNFLLLNLNKPNKISDPSWIRPGKVIREVTLTTQGGRACVDFATKYNLQFVEFDAGWYGSEYDDASDATTITVDPKRSPGPLDLNQVIQYANSKNIGVILYVNRRALEKQLDDILPLFRSWGIAGVKYGFVNVGSQEWTTWLHEAVRKAADQELMVDIHDQYRPTGYSRTYPNLMSQEGIRGDEESPPNEMVLNTLFTRMIAGAGDHTNCYFADRVEEKMGSHASQMAKSICLYSPWQFLFWYDRPAGSPGIRGGVSGADISIPDIPDLQFFAQLPTVWDDTRVLDGYPGEFAVVARQSGENWFVGALNGIGERQFEFDLKFLDSSKKYQAVVYSDDASLGTRTNVRIGTIEVDHQSVISRKILERNGLAMVLTPVTY